MTRYATAVGFPRHLAGVAMQNAHLIGEIVIEASRVIAKRAKGDVALGACVGIALSTLLQEYESGQHTKAEDFDYDALARKNAEALETPSEIAAVVEQGRAEFGAERVERVAAGLYEARRRLTPVNTRTGDVYPKFDDERVYEKTRDEHRAYAVFMLRADR